MTLPRILPASLLLAAIALSGCGKEPPADVAGAKRDGFAGMADKAAAGIRHELATEDLDIGRGVAGAPSAAISPQGDLIIAGDKVALSTAQHALVLEYRTHLAGVAEAGAQVGLEAAALAGTAMKEAAAAAFSGDGASVERHIEAKAEGVRASAELLCGRLPDLLASQRRVAAAVPEFVPYANMTEADIDDCHKDASEP